MRKLTNEDIDKRLFSIKIKRLGEYAGVHSPINFQCLELNCNHIWPSQPNHILNRGSGCPKCAEVMLLTNEIMDERLVNRNIKRLGEYKGNSVKTKTQCLNNNCNHIWEPRPNDLFRGKGCPKCSDRLITNEKIDQGLIGRNIKRIGNYKGCFVGILCKCLIKGCNHKWKPTPNNLLGGSGCPACKHKNEKIIYKFFKDNKIIFEYQKDIRKLINNEKRFCKVDFYFPSRNIIIEYNGEQHYRPVCFGGIELELAEENFIKQQERDLYIDNLCKNNNLTLIIIDGRKYQGKSLTKYLETELLEILKCQKKTKSKKKTKTKKKKSKKKLPAKSSST